VGPLQTSAPGPVQAAATTPGEPQTPDRNDTLKTSLAPMIFPHPRKVLRGAPIADDLSSHSAQSAFRNRVPARVGRTIMCVSRLTQRLGRIRGRVRRVAATMYASPHVQRSVASRPSVTRQRYGIVSAGWSPRWAWEQRRTLPAIRRDRVSEPHGVTQDLVVAPRCRPCSSYVSERIVKEGPVDEFSATDEPVHARASSPRSRQPSPAVSHQCAPANRPPSSER